jgi:branched-chain amino acid transport system substrate-binding protein
MEQQLTRREALVAALAATALGGRALARPASARAAPTARIGVILPLSHPGDTVAGSNVLKTVRLWSEWINSHGGVGGQQVSLSIFDDKDEPNRGAQRVVRAVHDHCSVILAGWASDSAQAEALQAHKLKVPLFVSYAWSVDVTKVNYPEVVRIGPNNDMLPNAIASFMGKSGYQKVAIVQEDTAFGQGFGAATRTNATLAGIDIRAFTFRRDTHDLRPTLKHALAGTPDALVVASAAAPAQYLGVTQARAAGFHGDVILGWDYVDKDFWKATGKQGIGVIWPTFSSPKLHLTPAGVAFEKLFVKRYKTTPLIYQAFTWDQLNAWKWAVDTAGSLAPADVIPVLPKLDLLGTTGRITLSHKPGTVHFNQWEGVTVYFDQAAKQDETDTNASVIASVTP